MGAKYPHLLRAVFSKPWAIDPNSIAWAAIRDVLLLRASGGALSDDEVRGRIAAATNGPRQGGQRSGTVAVIPIYGPITSRQNMMSDTSGGTSLEQCSAAFQSALADPGVDAIVLEVDSPGGTVDGVPELAADIRAARATKPVYAIANTMAASAAYWLACQAERVFVTPSGSVGSIGVFAAHHDLSAAYEMEGEKVSLITASVSPFKAEGNEYEPLSDEARANLQAQVDQFGQMFVRDVAKGRGVPIDTVRLSFGQGRVVLASDAMSAGMVDAVDTLDNCIRQASRAAITRQRESAAAESFRAEFNADLGSGLPFSDRLALVSAAAGGLLDHARERAEMRAREGRSPLSAAERDALRLLAGSLAQVAEPESNPVPVPPVPDPEPTPPTPSAWTDKARIRLALAQAELGTV